MTTIVILGIFLIAALIIVSLVNHAQERRRIRHRQQQHYRHQVTNLEEILGCLMRTVPNRMLSKQINDEIMTVLQLILRLESGNKERIEASIRSAETQGEELLNGRQRVQTSYQKDSDVHIAQSHHYINEAGRVLRYRFNQGLITEEELEVFQAELAWAYLMVSVTSLIAQGQKASQRGDMFSAYAFYQKAQHALMESAHPDPKRLRMIKELADMIAGNRKNLSQDLMPADSSAT